MLNKRTAFFYAVWVNVIFIIYGSLVPFEIRHHTLAQAWESFRHIPYLKLGVASRADWIANIVLYIPFAFFASAWLGSGRYFFSRRPARALSVFAAGAALAVGVEFTQIWFAPRTVSLNDIIAEIIGTVLGIILWEVAGDRLTGLAKKIIAGGPPAVKAMVTFYVLGYLAFSFFPYDFIVTPQELAWKLGTGRVHLIWAHCASTFFCLTGLVAEILAVTPLGVWVGMHYKQDQTRSLRIALYVGLGLGVIVELAQFFLASGVSQGISVLTRAGGVVLGAALYQRISLEHVDRMARYFRPVILVGAVPYAVALVTLNGWFSGSWIGVHEAAARLTHLHFLPFYYHYFSTETAALLSLVRQMGTYLPIGVAYWAWRWPAGRTAILQRAWRAAGIAAGAAFIVDGGKLFVSGKHPDPTDVLIAAGAAALGYVLAVWIRRWALEPLVVADMEKPREPMVAPTVTAVEARQPSYLRRMVSSLIGIVVLVIALRYPLHAAWLCLALVGYTLLLWCRPSLWLLVLPALLPVLNFAPWTGWFFFDEFDLFVLVTVAVGLLRAPASNPEFVMPRLAVFLVALLATSFVISLLFGLFPLSPLDANAFFNYMSHYNALRVAKGFVWALALLPLLRHATRHEEGNPAALFVVGMVLGLAGVVTALLWERFLYPGLFDFRRVYRITATFFSMHTGGPQIEAYLIFALPFVVAWAQARRNAWSMMVALALFGAGSYGVFVTFSRGGYLALAVILTIMVGSFFARRGMSLRAMYKRTAVVAVISLVLIVVAIPILQGSFAEARLDRTDTDLGGRIHHWRTALAMMDDGGMPTLFGMGLGRFPVTYRDKNLNDELPGNFRFMDSDGDPYLRLGAKDPLYLGQRVDVVDHHKYALSLDMRSSLGQGVLLVSLCEKYLLYSLDCQMAHIRAPDTASGWKHYIVSINSGDVGKLVHGFRRSVELAFSNPVAGTFVDVDNIRFSSPNRKGSNLVRNGDFSQGHDRWFFTTDDAVPWRIENVWLQVYFEQGLLGLIAFSLLVTYALLSVWKEAQLGRCGAYMLLASLVGFLSVGLFGSVLESPRLMLLFYLVLFMIMVTSKSGTPWLLQSVKKSSGPPH